MVHARAQGIVDEALSTVPPDPAKMKIKRTLQCVVRLTAIEAKDMAEWLNGHIAQYEKTFGKIVTPKDLERKEASTSHDNLN